MSRSPVLIKVFALVTLAASSFVVVACGAFDSSDDDDDKPTNNTGSSGDGSTTEGGGGSDAGDESSSNVDGASPPSCDLTKDFLQPAVRLTELDVANRSTAGGRLTADGKRIYYFHADPVDDSPGNFRIWTATRLDTTQPFSNPIAVNLQTAVANYDSHPTISDDGTTLFFQRAIGGIDPSNNRNIFYATIANGEVAQPLPVQGLAVPAKQERFPYAASDKSLWITIEVATKNRIARADFQGVGTYSDPQVVDLKAAVTEEDSYAVITSDLKRIYFTRTTGSSQNIFTASRPTAAATFEEPVPATDLNTAAGEDPTWISPDGCEIYIQRVVSVNAFSIFRATRPPL